jgi:hypothetical protein
VQQVVHNLRVRGVGIVELIEQRMKGLDFISALAQVENVWVIEELIERDVPDLGLAILDHNELTDVATPSLDGWVGL